MVDFLFILCFAESLPSSLDLRNLRMEGDVTAQRLFDPDYMHGVQRAALRRMLEWFLEEVRFFREHPHHCDLATLLEVVRKNGAPTDEASSAGSQRIVVFEVLDPADDSVVAMGWFQDSSLHGIIQYIGVRDDMQRKGIFRTILAWWIRGIRKTNTGGVYLGTRLTNAPMMAILRTLGATQMDAEELPDDSEELTDGDIVAQMPFANLVAFAGTSPPDSPHTHFDARYGDWRFRVLYAGPWWGHVKADSRFTMGGVVPEERDMYTPDGGDNVEKTEE